MDGPADRPRPRRHPRRRHGSGQDRHAHRAAPEPHELHRKRTAKRPRRPWSCARRRCWATGSARSSASRPACRCSAITARARGSRTPPRASSSRPTPRCAPIRTCWPSTHPGWGLVVADEAQNVKNPRSRGAQALRDIPSDARIAMTGTPVENNLSELWAILDWTTPGLLGTHDQFRTQWSRRIESRPRRRGGQRLVHADPPVPAASPQERSRHRPGAAAQDRDRPHHAPDPRAGRAVRGGRAPDDGPDRAGRGHPAARPGGQAADPAQADLQPPGALPARDRGSLWAAARASSASSTSWSRRSWPRTAGCWCSRSTPRWAAC